MGNCSKTSGSLPSFIMLFILLIAGGCSKNQDDIALPIFDAIGGDFSLPSTLGKLITLSDYHGKVVLLNFGFTSCPDICPTVLSRLAKLNSELEAKYGINSQLLQVIFISVDPERDSTAILKNYLTFFDSTFIGISGSLEETKELAKRYAIYFEKLTVENNSYQVAHTDKILLLDKRGRLRGLYSHADDAVLLSAIVSLAEADL